MLITIKCLCELWSQNFKKYTNKKIQTGGRAPGAPALDPPLKSSRNRVTGYELTSPSWTARVWVDLGTGRSWYGLTRNPIPSAPEISREQTWRRSLKEEL